MCKIVSGKMCPSLSKLDLALIDKVRVFCVPNMCYIYIRNLGILFVISVFHFRLNISTDLFHS